MAVAPILQSADEHAMGLSALRSVKMLSFSSFSSGFSLAVRCRLVVFLGAVPVNRVRMTLEKRRVAPGMCCKQDQWVYLDPRGPFADFLGGVVQVAV